MKSMMHVAQDFLTNEAGPTATEYAIMLALILLVAIAAISALGVKVSSVFSALDGTLTTPGGS